MRMFRNDYSEGAAPRIMDALVATNDEQCVGYTEGDPHCERARRLILDACGLDEGEADVQFCVGGTSANVIGVTGMLRDWEGVICTRDAHINVHETGAVAACQTSCGRHMTRPAAVYVTNATELGGVWDAARLDAICDWAHERGLRVFLDGARLASALTSEGNDVTLSHIAHTVDAFYLGGTKNGMLFGEAMVIRDARLREAFPFLVKERGGLVAKGRLLGVQFEAAFERGEGDAEAPYWSMARHANRMAADLRAGLVGLGFEPYGSSPSNQQFFVVSPAQQAAFEQAVGAETFYVLDAGRKVVRFVTSWATSRGDVDDLLEFAATIA